jgi:hypothetical protein
MRRRRVRSTHDRMMDAATKLQQTASGILTIAAGHDTIVV